MNLVPEGIPLPATTACTATISYMTAQHEERPSDSSHRTANGEFMTEFYGDALASNGDLPGESVSYLLTKVHVTTSAMASRHFTAELGITAKQANVIRFLATKPAVKVTQVARRRHRR